MKIPEIDKMILKMNKFGRLKLPDIKTYGKTHTLEQDGRWETGHSSSCYWRANLAPSQRQCPCGCSATLRFIARLLHSAWWDS